MKDTVNEIILTSDPNSTYQAAGPGAKLTISFDNIPEEVKEGGRLECGNSTCFIDKVLRDQSKIILYPFHENITMVVAPSTKFQYFDVLISLPKASVPVVDFDIESTGTDPQKDRIVEIAMIKMLDGKIVDEFTMYINPQMPIPASATEVHKITDEMVKDAPIFKDVAPIIHGFIQGCDLFGFNIMRFDTPMLFNEFERAGIIWDYHKHEYIDAFRAYKEIYPDNLMGAYKRLFNEEFDASHSALADIKATRRLFEALGMENKTREELTRLSNFGSPLLDLSGKFAWKDGEIVINFGNKHKGEKAKDCKTYISWMMKEETGFSSDVKTICKQILES